MTDDEKFLLRHWEFVYCCEGSYRSYPRGTILVQDVNLHWFNFDSWSAATEFTRARLELIKDKQEEIEWLGRQRSSLT